MGESNVMTAREDMKEMMVSLEAPVVEGEEDVKVEELDVDENGKIVREVKAEEKTEEKAEEKTEKKEEGEEKSEEKTEESSNLSEDQREKELSELRALAREQKRELTVMKETVERMNKVQQGEVGDTTHTEPGELEKLQAEILSVKQERSSFLTESKALMEINPKFEDIDSVITTRRVSDIIELAAAALAPKYSKDEVTMSLIIEKNIWSMPNPYKYLYELIKDNHPDFSKKEVAVEKKEGEEKKEVVTKHPDSKVTDKPTTVITPTAISSVTSGTQNNGGWTSARIDDLPESELSKVPKDVYAAYLAGELP